VCGESRMHGDNGGMERRVAGYRALSLPTRQTAKKPGLAERSHGEFTRSGFSPTGVSYPACPKFYAHGCSAVITKTSQRRKHQ
jgi:hypothetical protein